MKDTQNQEFYQSQRFTSVSLWAARILALVNLAYIGYALNTINKIGHLDRGETAFAGMYIATLLATLTSIFLINKGKHALGTKILFRANLAPLVISGITLKDFGAVSIGFLIVYAYVFIAWLLPPSSKKAGMFGSVFAAAVIIFGDLLNFSFQIESTDIKNIVPVITIIMAVAFALLILQSAWKGSIHTKNLIGFGVIAIIGGGLTYASVFLVTQLIKAKALPSREALQTLATYTQKAQAETLTYIALSNEKSTLALRETEGILTGYAQATQTLATEIGQDDLFVDLIDISEQIVGFSQQVTRNHTETLRLIEEVSAHEKDMDDTLEKAQTALAKESTKNTENADSEILSRKILLAKDNLAKFSTSINAFNHEVQSYVLARSTNSVESYAHAVIDLEKTYEELIHSLKAIEGQENLINLLQNAKERSLTLGEDIIKSHQDTLILLAQYEEYGNVFNNILDETGETIKQNTTQGLQRIKTISLIAAIAMLLISLAIGQFITNTITTPLSRLIDATQELEKGNFSVRANLRSGDELGALANAFNRMASQLGRTLTSLEKEVSLRTAALQQHSYYLESAANVSQTISTINQPEEIIKQVVDIIQDRFEFYYVGLFLMDKTQEWAVLQAGTGLPGKAMLARGHRIHSGEGMIGWSVSNATSRIALDVGEDNVQFSNPDLPKTRSEAALPLRSRGRVLGALTVQSVEEAAFNNDIVSTLQTMADQIASTLDNANLFAQSEAALGAERKAYGDLSQKEWIAFAQSQASSRFVSGTSSQTAYPLDVEQSPEILEAIYANNLIQDEGKTMLMPLISHNIILGGIKLRKRDGDGVWSKAQIALTKNLSGQLSIALDSARLFDQTQKRAAQEKVIAQTSAKMKETLDVESVLETAAKELRNALGIKTAEVWISVDEETKN